MNAPAAANTRPDIYLPRPARLVEIRPLTHMEMFFRFEMQGDDLLHYRAGQFIMLTLPGVGQVPISISSCPDDEGNKTFEMVIRRAGSVTNALHTLEPGAWVGVRGPYGTCFPVETDMRGKDILFVCGGLGLVPVRSAIDYVLKHRSHYGKVTILYGTRTPKDRLFLDQLDAWEARRDVHLLQTVDLADASWAGSVGVITQLFHGLPLNPPGTVAIVCGPPIMYKFVLLELYKCRIMPEQVFLSLERNMKCGVGKCGHCQINHLYACREGPVMRYSDLTDVREAI